MEQFYEMMFKRKSFRQFTGEDCISQEALDAMAHFINHVAVRLDEAIPIHHRIVLRHETTCKRGEYCILIYSDPTPLGLLNVGYVFEQLDFYLCSLDIGTCWYGMGKTTAEADEVVNGDGFPYIIMLAIGKASPESFRKNYKKATRKPNESVWQGNPMGDMVEYVKFAPSTCNSQPWVLNNQPDKTGGTIQLIYTPKEKMIVPKDKIAFYNMMDLGIMIFACDMWLKKHGIPYSREINKKQTPYEKGEVVSMFKWCK